jgi:hypothetical protein
MILWHEVERQELRPYSLSEVLESVPYNGPCKNLSRIPTFLFELQGHCWPFVNMDRIHLKYIGKAVLRRSTEKFVCESLHHHPDEGRSSTDYLKLDFLWQPWNIDVAHCWSANYRYHVSESRGNGMKKLFGLSVLLSWKAYSIIMANQFGQSSFYTILHIVRRPYSHFSNQGLNLNRK